MKHYLSRATVALTLGAILALGIAVAFAQVGVTLNPVGGSGVSGSATLEALDGQTRVTVTLTGLPANASRVGNIHLGTCASLGGIVIPLPNIQANASGTGVVTTTVNATLASLQDGNHAIAFLQSASLPSPGPSIIDVVISCGNIPTAVAVAPAPPVVAGVAVLPRAGGMAVPFAAATLLGLTALAIGVFLRRR